MDLDMTKTCNTEGNRQRIGATKLLAQPSCKQRRGWVVEWEDV